MEGDFYQEKPKSFWWVWVLLGIAIIAAAIYVVIFFTNSDTEKGNEIATKTDLSKSEFQEEWQIEPTVVMENTTSSDTHYLGENSYRMYFIDSGEIKYAESSDCKTFNTPKTTGIDEPPGKMISNPAVLEISATEWIMIYEQAPAKKPSSGKTPPGPATQRDLYFATSTDGKTFTKVGIAIDSSKEDEYFASVPDLVLLPDSSIRMYYVSGGDKIAATTSINGGKSWNREGIILSGMAVDPDVSYQKNDDGEQWVMYYSNLDPSSNAIYKSTSSDGIEWSQGIKLFTSTTNGAVVDPDVVYINDNEYVMFIGQSESGGSTAGEAINLYRATLSQSIY